MRVPEWNEEEEKKILSQLQKTNSLATRIFVQCKYEKLALFPICVGSAERDKFRNDNS